MYQPVSLVDVANFLDMLFVQLSPLISMLFGIMVAFYVGINVKKLFF